MTRLHATTEVRLAAGLAALHGVVAMSMRSEAGEVSGLEVRKLAASKLDSGLGYWDTSG